MLAFMILTARLRRSLSGEDVLALLVSVYASASAASIDTPLYISASTSSSFTSATWANLCAECLRASAASDGSDINHFIGLMVSSNLLGCLFCFTKGGFEFSYGYLESNLELTIVTNGDADRLGLGIRATSSIVPS